MDEIFLLSNTHEEPCGFINLSRDFFRPCFTFLYFNYFNIRRPGNLVSLWLTYFAKPLNQRIWPMLPHIFNFFPFLKGIEYAERTFSCTCRATFNTSQFYGGNRHGIRGFAWFEFAELQTLHCRR